ncbi:uncharacterized protein PG998_002321 [Apiospora kogelbergensis]|uniref:Uncharacterized protein n=1 Tax=Apiospora kogelbergensis TaxID=1337665 RepID=A0AAW0QKY0_9PEZI
MENSLSSNAACIDNEYSQYPRNVYIHYENRGAGRPGRFGQVKNAFPTIQIGNWDHYIPTDGEGQQGTPPRQPPDNNSTPGTYSILGYASPGGPCSRRGRSGTAGAQSNEKGNFFHGDKCVPSGGEDAGADV